MMTNLTSGNWDPIDFSIAGFGTNHFPPMRYAGEKAGKLRTVSPEMGIKSVPAFCGHDTQFAVFGFGAGLNQPVLSLWHLGNLNG